MAVLKTAGRRSVTVLDGLDCSGWGATLIVERTSFVMRARYTLMVLAVPNSTSESLVVPVARLSLNAGRDLAGADGLSRKIYDSSSELDK